jgi:hypothetical protein
MAVVLGVVVALVVLYLWLSGHWFGRALAFLAFGAVAVLVAVVCFTQTPLALGMSFIGLIAAWVAANLPVMVRERGGSARV